MIHLVEMTVKITPYMLESTTETWWRLVDAENPQAAIAKAEKYLADMCEEYAISYFATVIACHKTIV